MSQAIEITVDHVLNVMRSEITRYGLAEWNAGYQRGQSDTLTIESCVVCRVCKGTLVHEPKCTNSDMLIDSDSGN